MPSVTCLRLSHASVICSVTYFYFLKFNLLFLIYRSLGRTSTAANYWFNTQYRTSDVAENLGRYLSCTERTVWAKDTELIIRVKMETRHPVEGHLAANFRRFVIIAKLANFLLMSPCTHEII